MTVEPFEAKLFSLSPSVMKYKFSPVALKYFLKNPGAIVFGGFSGTFSSNYSRGSVDQDLVGVTTKAKEPSTISYSGHWILTSKSN
jgi:hypothetical protein